MQCHDLFVQYGELLRRNFSDEEHIAHTPDLYELVEEFGLDFAQAFQVLRPRLKAEMQKQIKAVKQPAEPVNGSGDTGMQVDEASPGNDAVSPSFPSGTKQKLTRSPMQYGLPHCRPSLNRHKNCFLDTIPRAWGKLCVLRSMPLTVR